MTDVYLYKLNYLDTALSVLRECKGYDKHIAEYQNNLNSTFFVTVVADVLVKAWAYYRVRTGNIKYWKQEARFIRISNA